jgi:hypothetical protein
MRTVTMSWSAPAEAKACFEACFAVESCMARALAAIEFCLAAFSACPTIPPA